jgi:hypothetical protein
VSGRDESKQMAYNCYLAPVKSRAEGISRALRNSIRTIMPGEIGRDYVDNGPGRALKPQLFSTRPHPLLWRYSGSNPVVPPFLSINCYPRQSLDSVHPKPEIKRREDGTGCVLDELKLSGGEREVLEGRGGGSEKGNSGGKPRSASSDPDEEHRASAGIRHRRRK